MSPYRTPIGGRPNIEAQWLRELLLFPFRRFQWARKRMGGHWERRWTPGWMTLGQHDPTFDWWRVHECSGHQGLCEDWLERP